MPRDIKADLPNKVLAVLLPCTWNVPANLDECVSISVAGVAAAAVCTGVDVAFDNSCSRFRILLCIKSMLRVETWVMSVAGEAGSAATLADEPAHVVVVDAVSGAGRFPFGIWTECVGGALS